MKPGNQEIPPFKIESFWDWFMGMEAHYKYFFTEEELVDKDYLVEAMNNQILDFDRFSWEIGPLADHKYYLTISPNGSKELLRKSKTIIKSAPSLPNWEFYPAKPPKAEPLTFRLFDEFMIERTVVANEWHFVLKRRPDDLWDVIIEAPSIKDLDQDTQARAGEIAVIRIIGEEQKINRIAKVIVVEEFPKGEEIKKESIRKLSQILANP